MQSDQKECLVDKIILAFFGVLLLCQRYESHQVVYLLIPLSLSLIHFRYSQVKMIVSISVAYLILTIFSANWLYFFSWLVYDVWYFTKPVASGSFMFATLVFLVVGPLKLDGNGLLIVGLLFLACYLASNRKRMNATKKGREKLEFQLFEEKYAFQRQLDDLLLKQELQLDLELAHERNRIARDIHDTVGHLLSSALLQIGALKVLNQASTMDASFIQLEETLTQGMNNIRSSVHDLHDQSLSFEQASQNILENFTFCELEQVGKFTENLDLQYKLAYLMIIKEGLANVMKHSNATKVTLHYQTYPAFYKLTLADNGRKNASTTFFEKGIGLIGMRERLEKLGGRLSYEHSAQGFKLLAILPKKGG